MVGRKRRSPETTTPPATLTIHQIVAYNFARARSAEGWTQVETSDRLEPFLGYKLNQAGVSAIEKTYDSERRRNIDTADVVAFARCFKRPIGWFFLPPPKRGGDILEPVYSDQRFHLPAAELVALAVGTPHGWQLFLDRITELLRTDRRLTADALHYALDGYHGRAEIEDQINFRRQAIRAITLARHATPADDVIKQMAELLVQLVNLTPPGMDKLRVTDPDAALLLLEEGDSYLGGSIAFANQRRKADYPSSGGFDDVESIDLAAALDPDQPADADGEPQGAE